MTNTQLVAILMPLAMLGFAGIFAVTSRYYGEPAPQRDPKSVSLGPKGRP